MVMPTRTRAGHYSPEAGERRRNEGIERVSKAADPTWRATALDAIEQLAKELPEFTADEVRHRVRILPHHKNAWGALMTTAAHRGWIQATDRTRMSVRTAAHRHRNPIWTSLIHTPGGEG